MTRMEEAASAIRDGHGVEPRILLELLRHADWAGGRSLADLERALAATPVVLAAFDGERCVGMIRVLTDGVYRALIEDVIVAPDARGQGWGERLMEAALEHPLVRDVELTFLFTGIPDFYRRFGYIPDPGGMRRSPAKDGRA